MITCVYICKMKPETKEEFLFEVRRTQVEEIFRGQKGCKYFHISITVGEEDWVFLNDAWEDEETYDGHVTSAAGAAWDKLEKAYTIPGESVFHKLYT